MKSNQLLAFMVMLFITSVITPVIAQVKPQDLSNIRVDELSDDQVRSFTRQLEATGLGDAQLEQVAQARGMKRDEIVKLRERANKLKEQDQKKDNTTDPNRDPKIGRQVNSQAGSDPVDRTPETEAEKALDELRTKIFGATLFKNSNLTFEPNLNLATPQNYVIGTGDEILIDITGNSEASYNLKVSPEGNINVEYIGVIPVNGLTVEAATGRIRSRMSAVYSGLKSGNTRLNVAIGNIRSIKVILTGEVQKPGTYTLPSLATVFNALYSSGGPTENGSFRSIEIIRGGRIVSVLDIYDFLLEGEMKSNIGLRDQDIIRIPVYRSRMEIVGEVKRPGIFEMLPGENFTDLLRFAGNFTEEAYKTRVKVFKTTDTERKIADINLNEFASYVPASGDKYFVDRVLERFANRVSIEGAVFRPGQYELTEGLTLRKLIEKSEGLREDAFRQRGYIIRLGPDNQTQSISFDVAAILNGSIADIPLIREDIISISSIFDLREEYNVSITGEIRQPGTFAFADNMTLEELIILAGGFTQGASSERIEISRRVKNSNLTSASAVTAQVFQVNVTKELDFSSPKFKLQPFDIVTVRGSIGYEVQRQVSVEGEVLYPGTYTITNKDERVSDLVKRAGGLTALAYPKGASLKREGPRLQKGKNAIDLEEEEQNKLAKLQRLQETEKDSLDIEQQQDILKNVYVGIELDKILIEPGKQSDLTLEEGDVLRVPKQLQTVKINGEVLYPVTTIYNLNKGFKYYISQGGGFSNKSRKRRSYVIYANGAVKSTSKILFFNSYPRIEPGAELFVPKKDDSQKLSSQELLGLTTGIASLGAIILGIMNLSK